VYALSFWSPTPGRSAAHTGELYDFALTRVTALMGRSAAAGAKELALSTA
jgi:hypothetical protein